MILCFISNTCDYPMFPHHYSSANLDFILTSVYFPESLKRGSKLNEISKNACAVDHCIVADKRRHFLTL